MFKQLLDALPAEVFDVTATERRFIDLYLNYTFYCMKDPSTDNYCWYQVCLLCVCDVVISFVCLSVA